MYPATQIQHTVHILRLAYDKFYRLKINLPDQSAILVLIIKLVIIKLQNENLQFFIFYFFDLLNIVKTSKSNALDGNLFKVRQFC